MLPGGYQLRPTTMEDAASLAEAYDRNREHLAPWDPVREPSFFTADGQAAVLRHQLDSVRAGHGDAWLLHHGGAVVGRVNLNNLVRGALQSASVGYWVDRDHLGRGLAVALVEAMAERATVLGLHRLEAATQMHNVASQRVLLRCGFEHYGTAPRFLFIAGEWRDHHLYQRILHDQPPGNPAPRAGVGQP